MWDKLSISSKKKRKKKKRTSRRFNENFGANKEELLVVQGPRWDAPSCDNQLSYWLIRRNYSANQRLF